jgi:tetratricopeptide (TPR) repeat protein
MPRRTHDRFERFSLAQYLGRPFRAVWNWGSRLAAGDDFRSHQSNPVVSVLLFPVRFLFSCVLFLINSWTVTRHVRPFLGGVPALLAITGVAGATWLDYFRHPNKVQRTQRYFEKFLTEADRGPKVAQHFALKRLDLQPEDLQAKYLLADVWYQLGETARAIDLMEYLLEQDYVLAHVWFARQYLSSGEGLSSGLSAEEKEAKIDYHLQQAIKLEPDSGPAKITLADHLLSKADRISIDSPEYRQFLEKASDYLIEVSESDSGEIIWHLPKLMRALVELDNQASAKSVFLSSKKMLLQFMRKFPADERIPQLWTVLISAAIQLKDYDQAEEMIDEGRRQTRNPTLLPMFDELAARKLLQQVADIEQSDSPDRFDQALELLGKAMIDSPTDGLIANKLVGMIVPDAADGTSQASQLEKSRSVSAPAVAHLLLGMDKVLKGDVLAGQVHWRIAETQAVNTQLILFSLIRSLITRHADRFENRGDVISLAIEQFPNQGLFYFLRGTDFMRRADFQQAIPNLEQAIKMVQEPGNFEIRFQLAKCFRALKDQEKLDEQRRVLQTIIQGADTRQRGMLEDYLRQLDE